MGRFVVGPGHHLPQESQGDELNAQEEKKHGQEEERPSGDPLLEDQPDVGEVKPQYQPQSTGQQAEGSEDSQGLGGVVLKELDGDQVEDHPKGAGDSVFALAEAAGPVVDLLLPHPRPLQRGQGRDETVLFPVELQVLGDLFTVNLEGATVVVELNPCDQGDQSVGDHRGKPPVQEGVFPMEAPPVDQVQVSRLHGLG